jgi:hypothetical protein
MFEGLQALVGMGPKARAVESDAVSLPATPVDIAPPPEPVPNWDEEARTDLPPRTPEQIQWLLKFETPEQTQKRIENDKSRYVFARSGEKSLLWSRTHPQGSFFGGQ